MIWAGSFLGSCRVGVCRWSQKKHSARPARPCSNYFPGRAVPYRAAKTKIEYFSGRAVPLEKKNLGTFFFATCLAARTKKSIFVFVPCLAAIKKSNIFFGPDLALPFRTDNEKNQTNFQSVTIIIDDFGLQIMQYERPWPMHDGHFCLTHNLGQTPIRGICKPDALKLWSNTYKL